MTQKLCPQLKMKFEDLKALKKELDLDLENIQQNKGTKPALELQEKIEDMIFSIKEILTISPEKAKEIMGEKDFLGAVEIEKAFGVKIDHEKIPKIPFSKKDLERAKEMDQFLILRFDKTLDGKKFNLENLGDLLSEEFENKKAGRIFFPMSRVSKGELFDKNTPRLSWALVSKNPFPDSERKTYLEQTESIVNHLKENVFRDGVVLQEYQDAIDEFYKKKPEIESLMDSQFKNEAETILTSLLINKLCRQSVSEYFYDVLAYFMQNNERIMDNMKAWTSTLSYNDRGGFASMIHYTGPFEEEGIRVGSENAKGAPFLWNGNPALYFSRVI